jgi:hypothetical protein
LPFAACAGDSTEKSRPWYYNRFETGGLANLYTLDTKASLVPDGEASDDIDLEATLGLSDNLRMGSFTFDWRPSVKERWSFDLFSVGRGGEKVIDEEIHWGDEVYPINAIISTKAQTSTIRATYHYSLYHDEKTEAGLGLGAYIMRVYLSLGLEAEGIDSKAESTTITAPLPVIAAFGQTKFADKWAVGGEVDWFGVSVSGIKGRVLNLNANVAYLLSEDWNLKLGYETFGIKVSRNGDLLDAQAETGFSGLYFGATYTWN